MSDQEQTYNAERARMLERMLVALADRIQALAASGRLLGEANELMKLVGDVKSELFHYEVRATYDTPEVAESRRIVSDMLRPDEPDWDHRHWTPDSEEHREW